jgi:hypothetical protein
MTMRGLVFCQALDTNGARHASSVPAVGHFDVAAAIRV